MEKIKERRKQNWDNMFYSLQRMDLLIVSFSGAGIYVCLETIKYFADNAKELEEPISPLILLLKISGFILVMSVVLNFLSQLYGYLSNQQDYLKCESELDLFDTSLEDDVIQKLNADILNFDKQSGKYSNITSKLNHGSMCLMLVGLFTIVFFFAVTF